MSGLSAPVIASKIIHVNDDVAGGVYGVGNDTTGDGSAGAPYATGGQALLELFNHEPTLLSPWRIRFLCAVGETNDYGAISISTANAPANDANNYISFEGWLKTFADQPKQG